MTPFRNPLAIGAAALAIVAGGVAVAQMKNAHVLTVRLADGSVEQIGYFGDVAPRVSLRPAEVPIAFVPADDLFAADLPFAGFDRVFADMDREADAMMRQADAMQRAAMRTQGLQGPQGLMQTGFADLPAGVRSYSVVTTIQGGKACTRTVELTGDGAGRAPKVLTSRSGDCRAAEAPAQPATAPATPARAPGLVQASYRGEGAPRVAQRPVALTD